MCRTDECLDNAVSSLSNDGTLMFGALTPAADGVCRDQDRCLDPRVCADAVQMGVSTMQIPLAAGKVEAPMKYAKPPLRQSMI